MKQLLVFTCILVLSCHKPDTGNLNIQIIAPTAFLPVDAHGNQNSRADCKDGTQNCNRVFRIQISNPEGVPLQYELTIVDQRGAVLLSGLSNMNEGWNGREHNHSKLAPQGTYIYRFKATNPNTGDFKTQKGEFALLR